MSVFITGDTHGSFRRFSTLNFPEQRELNKKDYMIICGDFGGIWKDSPEERYWLDWLNDKPFTILYVDGNHENFDRYYNNEFREVRICGGKAHEIRDSVFHLMRGEVYEIEGKTFFAFGGASSHDIKDGIVDPTSFCDDRSFKKKLQQLRQDGAQFRIKGLSWWPQELPDEDEMQHGISTLQKYNNKVNFVITHCLPQEVASVFSMGLYEADSLTMYLNKLLHNSLTFDKWFCGHYHLNGYIMGKFVLLYDQIMRII